MQEYEMNAVKSNIKMAVLHRSSPVTQQNGTQSTRIQINCFGWNVTRLHNPTYQLFIAVLSIYWRTIARHQFSDELKIFCWKLIFVVHELYVLFPNTSFNGWWHFHDTQFCISYRKDKTTMYKIYQSQCMLIDNIQAWTEHMMFSWHWPHSVCGLLSHDTMFICRCTNDISKAAWCLNHQTNVRSGCGQVI